jgi:hypothetical protein
MSRAKKHIEFLEAFTDDLARHAYMRSQAGDPMPIAPVPDRRKEGYYDSGSFPSSAPKSGPIWAEPERNKDRKVLKSTGRGLRAAGRGFKKGAKVTGTYLGNKLTQDPVPDQSWKKMPRWQLKELEQAFREQNPTVLQSLRNEMGDLEWKKLTLLLGKGMFWSAALYAAPWLSVPLFLRWIKKNKDRRDLRQQWGLPRGSSKVSLRGGLY